MLLEKDILISYITGFFKNNLIGTVDYIGELNSGKLNYYEIMIMSTSVLCLILLLQCFYISKEKNKRGVIILSSILSIFEVIFTNISYIFNGFSVISNRWTYLIMFTMVLNLGYLTVNRIQTLQQDYIQNQQGYYYSTTVAINYIKNMDKSFYRIDKDFYSVWLNDSLFQNYMGIKSYNSLNEPGYLEFIDSFNRNRFKNDDKYIAGFDGKYDILAFLGVKYILSKNANLCT